MTARLWIEDLVNIASYKSRKRNRIGVVGWKKGAGPGSDHPEVEVKFTMSHARAARILSQHHACAVAVKAHRKVMKQKDKLQEKRPRGLK